MLVPLIVGAALLSVPSAPADCSEQCAQEILQAARSFVSSRRYPAHVQYRVRVTLHKSDGAREPRTYRSAYDAVKNVIYVKSISSEEEAHPPNPYGTNIAMGAMGSYRVLGRPVSDPDVLGVPFLTPTYAFGLGRGSAAVRPSPGDLREIGRVATTSLEYTASYLGADVVAGEPCLRVGLLPRRDAYRSRLRELWVALADGAPLKARVHGNFLAGPWDGIDWTIAFRRAGDTLYLDSETTDDPVRLNKARAGRVAVEFLDIVEKDFRREFLASVAPSPAAREP